MLLTSVEVFTGRVTVIVVLLLSVDSRPIFSFLGHGVLCYVVQMQHTRCKSVP